MKFPIKIIFVSFLFVFSGQSVFGVTGADKAIVAEEETTQETRTNRSEARIAELQSQLNKVEDAKARLESKYALLLSVVTESVTVDQQTQVDAATQDVLSKIQEMDDFITDLNAQLAALGA